MYLQEINAMTRSVWGDVNRDFLSGSSPAVPSVGASLGATDVKETENGYELHVDVPGLTKDDVKVASRVLCTRVLKVIVCVKNTYVGSEKHSTCWSR